MFAALFLELEEELFTEASEETEELIEETLEETEDIWEETEEAEEESAETEEPATLVAETKLDRVATGENWIIRVWRSDMFSRSGNWSN